jgi:DnaJ homolog subfamily A member 5
MALSPTSDALSTDFSARQFDAHLKGKKHLKAVQALRRSMREEDENLGVSDAVSTHGTATPDTHIARKSADAEPDDVNETPDLEEEFVEPVVEESPYTHRRSEERQNTQDIDGAHSENRTDGENEMTSTKQTVAGDQSDHDEGNSDVELEREIDKLYLGLDHTNKAHPVPTDGKPKIGAAKAKRQKRAEKQAAIDAESRSQQKPRNNRKPFDPSAAVQKARGETVTTGRRAKKK